MAVSTQKQAAPNQIVRFFHCGQCLDEKPDDVSPREYAQIEVGFTKPGLQVWCKRHERQIIHLDFKGQKVGVVG